MSTDLDDRRAGDGTERLFVYGSLRPGAPTAGGRAGVAGAWAPGRVRGRLERRGWGAELGFPALVLDPEGEMVPGDVLTSGALSGLWRTLDAFEGREYRRVSAPVELEDGSTVTAYVYVLHEGPPPGER